jgi:hypothetical protein
MEYQVTRMTRPLTGAERAQIEAARRKIDKLQAQLAEAIRERDLAVLAAYNSRGKVLELAEAAGVSRQGIYTILGHFERFEGE